MFTSLLLPSNSETIIVNHVVFKILATLRPFTNPQILKMQLMNFWMSNPKLNYFHKLIVYCISFM